MPGSIRSPPTRTARSAAGVVSSAASSQRAYSRQYWVDSSATVASLSRSTRCSSGGSSGRVSGLHTTAPPVARTGKTSSITTSKPSEAICSQRSAGVRSSRSATASANAASAPRSITMPLGRPVDPEVNRAYADCVGAAGTPVYGAAAGPASMVARSRHGVPSGSGGPCRVLSWSQSTAPTRATRSFRPGGRPGSRTLKAAPVLSTASMERTASRGRSSDRPTTLPRPHAPCGKHRCERAYRASTWA